MEVLDSPNFAPAVQNYSQQRNPTASVGAKANFALVRSSSLATYVTFMARRSPSVSLTAASSLPEGARLPVLRWCVSSSLPMICTNFFRGVEGAAPYDAD